MVSAGLVTKKANLLGLEKSTGVERRRGNSSNATKRKKTLGKKKRKRRILTSGFKQRSKRREKDDQRCQRTVGGGGLGGGRWVLDHGIQWEVPHRERGATSVSTTGFERRGEGPISWGRWAKNEFN